MDGERVKFELVLLRQTERGARTLCCCGLSEWRSDFRTAVFGMRGLWVCWHSSWTVQREGRRGRDRERGETAGERERAECSLSIITSSHICSVSFPGLCAASLSHKNISDQLSQWSMCTLWCLPLISPPSAGNDTIQSCTDWFQIHTLSLSEPC